MEDKTGDETRSIWMKEPLPDFDALPGDREADVVVVGAGITGVTTALMLQRRGRRVVLLDAGKVADGETARSTAHLTVALDGRLSRLLARFGREDAAVAVRAHQAAIDWIQGTVDELAIDCDFARVPGYLYAERPPSHQDGDGDGGEDDRQDVELVDAEERAARELGLEVEAVSSLPLPLEVARAIRFPGQAQIHPRRYLAGLLRQLAELGGEIYERTRVVGVEDGDPCRVDTERGTLTARAVVVAAHVPVVNRLFLHAKLEPMRSYVLAVRDAGPVAPGLYWDTAQPYHYWRTAQAEGERLLLVGGADHKVGEAVDTEAAFRRLERYLRRRLGRLEVRTRWSGQIIEPADGLPYVGRNSLSRRVFVATGYSGNGITGGTAAAMILATEVSGTAHPWSDLFAATRMKPVASARAFVRQNASAARHLVADRFRALAPETLANLPAGAGEVVDAGGEKLAVYREPCGALRALSAVCTHLGCLVAWNNAEQSWDCPCHGSRFAPDGEVVNGPAVRPLERRDLSTLLTDEADETEAYSERASSSPSLSSRPGTT